MIEGFIAGKALFDMATTEHVPLSIQLMLIAPLVFLALLVMAIMLIAIWR